MDFFSDLACQTNRRCLKKYILSCGSSCRHVQMAANNRVQIEFHMYNHELSITLDITLDVGLKYNILMCLSLTSGWKLKTLFYWRYTAVDEHGQAKHSSGLNLSLLEDQNVSKFDLNEFSDGLSTTWLVLVERRICQDDIFIQFSHLIFPVIAFANCFRRNQ